MNHIPIELQISHALRTQQSLSATVDQIEKTLDWRRLSENELASWCQFLLNAGFAGLLTKMLATHAKVLPVFPWAYFAEALVASGPQIPDQVKEAVITMAIENKSLEKLARSHAFDSFDDTLIDLRKQARLDRRLREHELRADLFQQRELLASQGLLEQEEKLLLKILRMFPGDREAFPLLVNCRQQRALEMLSRRSHDKNRPPPIEVRDANELPLLAAIEKSQHQHLAKNPDLAIDFAISHWMWDNPDGALRFLENEPASPSRDWLRLDLFLKARRYIEALEDLELMERRYGADPETTWASAYFRAQALWGLNEKFQALEILESLCATQPDYRSAAILLAEMRENLG